MTPASTPNNPKKIVEQGYDKAAHEYAQLEGEVEWPRMRWLGKVLKQLEPGSYVLDLGCGNGDPAGIKIAKQHQLTGVDISAVQIEQARQNVPGGTFIHGDLGSVDFPAGSFDTVVSFYTIEHVPRREHSDILRRIHGWLNPDGLFLISLEAADYDDVHGEWLGVPMFLSVYDPDTMRRMVGEAGFEIIETDIEVQIENTTEIPFQWILARKI